ncbi:hypothetical protein BHU72_01085 [Desulfuribacillus stibiiarsenatis]|uniref:Dehydrogenase n=1 Tax=Desulfuribacillus stibiiarsenatis TaxID=1390249 RepID=A0A1E5L9R7_9FIRM|nr:molecular chaperone TorD family protein [Desulfuribacillus stibiiarsenatis]OEH86887.1 hypothetical protein BHU72_01085 [Desulfuribacillus stibiiarsenatis]
MTINLLQVEMNQAKLSLYHILSQYYLKGVQKLNKDIVQTLREINIEEYPDIQSGIQRIIEGLSQDEDSYLQTNYEYSKLFVGPEKVVATPYESVYRSRDRLLMQKETIDVRNFYRKLGLEVIKKGSQPDDHLGLELDCMCYMLYQSLKQPEEQFYNNLYRDFIKNHISQWVPKHCELVLEYSKTLVCTGMAQLLKGLIALELSSIEQSKQELDVLS